MYRADFIAEVVPGIVLVAATYIAAVPAFRTVRQSSRGRARLAMAWISGSLFGLVATTLLSVAIEEAADPDASVAGFGLRFSDHSLGYFTENGSDHTRKDDGPRSWGKVCRGKRGSKRRAQNQAAGRGGSTPRFDSGVATRAPG